MISIIIPTKNSAKYIKKTINSILAQKFSLFEIIICDGDSQDDTIKIIKTFRNKKIRIVSHSDEGVADALNKGFSSANGDIFCWLNSDDYFANSNVLNIVYKTFLNNKIYSYLVGDFHNVDKKNKLINSFISFVPNKKIKKFFFYNQIFTGALFFKKSCFKKFRKFDTKYKYAFEYEILVFLLKNFRGVHLNNFLACFRILPNQLSSNKDILKKELDHILKKNKLIYTNFALLRLISCIKQGSFLRLVKCKLKFYHL